MSNFSLSTLVRPETRITILDIGASLTEQPPYEHLIKSGLVRVIGFEPNQQECEKLNARYGRPHAFFPHFIGDGKPGVFWETTWFATGSLFKPNRPVLEKFVNLYELVTPVAQHPVETKRLDDIAEIDDADYIKIDVQGAELMVFKGAERLLDKVMLIQCEVEFVELYEQQPLFADVDTYLRSRNFMFQKFEYFGSRCIKPMTMNNTPYAGTHCLWADAIYTKNWLNTDSYSTDKLIKLAILSHDIYNVADLSYYLLQHVDTRQGTTYAPQYQQLLKAAAASAKAAQGGSA
jgi:protein O-GlcNAc transferase